jgi:hypothetical protein
MALGAGAAAGAVELSECKAPWVAHARLGLTAGTAFPGGRHDICLLRKCWAASHALSWQSGGVIFQKHTRKRVHFRPVTMIMHALPLLVSLIPVVLVTNLMRVP